MSQGGHQLHLSLTSIQTVSLAVGAAISLGTPLYSGAFAQTTGPQQPPPVSPAPTSTPNPQPTTASDARFTCQWNGGQYKVMYHPESRQGEFFPWAVPKAMGGGWTEERRCVEISRRLEEYRPDGLTEMRTGVENGYNIVCATAQRNSTCRIIFTVPPGQDPTKTRDLVFQNLTTADSGQQTQGINTLVDTNQDTNWLGQIIQDLSTLGSQATSTSNAINLRPFLDSADGGTGEALAQGIRSNPQLNPDQFR